MEIANELGVIVRFASLCESRGLTIELIRSGFPDALIYNQRTDEHYRAEFEFRASSFAAHRHKTKDCDIVICWENDWPDCPITVWEISQWDAGPFALPNISIPFTHQKIEALEKENRQLKRELRQARHDLFQTKLRFIRLEEKTEAQLKQARRETILLDLRDLRSVACFIHDLPINPEVLHRFAMEACYNQPISRETWVDDGNGLFPEEQFNCLQDTLLEFGMATRGYRQEWSLTHTGLALMSKIAKREL